MEKLYNYGSSPFAFLYVRYAELRHIVNPKNGKPAGMISTETIEVVRQNAQLLDSAIIYDRDFNYN